MNRINVLSEDYIQKFRIYEYTEDDYNLMIVENNHIITDPYVNTNIYIVFRSIDWRIDDDVIYTNQEFYTADEIEFLNGSVYKAFKDYQNKNLPELEIEINNKITDTGEISPFEELNDWLIGDYK